ncbi:DUF4303 domain-containing protein (plasmid) [Acaryochloris sp. CCMEE 5410]|nr:DUF4303 domain-containing protein [Acaryochloris sp. CCMEE 5410]
MISNLSDELFDAATSYFHWWQNVYPEQKVYAYGFYTTPCVEWAGIVVMTEDGLRTVANEYKEKDYYRNKSIDELITMLRWSPEDSPHCLENNNIFSSVNKHLAKVSETTHGLDVDDDAFCEYIDSLYKALIAALLRFRAEILGNSREPLLSVWFGDQSDKEIEYFIESCNDLEILDWYRKTVT